MSDERNSGPLQEYIKSILGPEQAPFLLAKKKAAEFGREGMSISRSDAEALAFFIKSQKCKKFVEVGMFTGYSALHIAAALGQGGELWTCELENKHVAAGKEVFASAKPDCKIEILQGDARESLVTLAKKGPFDGVFIDANKGAYDFYLRWADENLRSGGIIVCDNIFLDGAVFDFAADKVDSQHWAAKAAPTVHAVNKFLLSSGKYDAAVIPTSDGMMYAIKR